MNNQLLWFGIVSKKFLIVVREADPGVAGMGEDKEGLAAKDDHKRSNGKLLILIESWALQVPLKN